MAYADEVLADSPNAYWKMDEASGLVADTASGTASATRMMDEQENEGWR